MRRERVSLSIGLAVVLLCGVFLLVAGAAPAVIRAASVQSVFVIPPGNAERVPFDRADGICTLAEAVEAANDQGVSDPPLNDCGSASPGLNIIELQAGNYDLTAQVATINGGNTATFNIVTPITIRGVTSDTTAIRRTDGASEQFRFFHVGDGGQLTLEDLTLTGGYANAGSGGGAIYVFGSGTLTMTSTSLISNTARLGGALYNGGLTTITGSSIVGNSASENDEGLGGGIYSANDLRLTTSNLTGNSATQDGGGMYIVGTGGGTAAISLSSIAGNAANSDAAGSGSGGGIHHLNGLLTVTLSTFANNVALPGLLTDDGNGGGLYIAGQVEMSLTLITANAASNGAGLYQSGPGDSSITRTLFLANLASEAGAGIYNQGNLILDNSVLWANIATQGNGGGLHVETNGATTDIRNSTIYDNETVQGNGGGIYNQTDGAGWTALSNVTLASNGATAGSGGGIANGANGQIVIASSTVVDNAADAGDGGGISSTDPVTSHVRIRNTILSANTSSDTPATGNCSGALTSQDYNLDSGIGCGFTEGGDLSNGIANLDSLAPADPLQVLSGNITPAFDLLTGSHAINAGNPVACYDASNVNNNDTPLATDQWGEARIKDGRCDIGAVETDNPSPVSLVGLSATSGGMNSAAVAAMAFVLGAIVLVGARRVVLVRLV